MASARPTSKWSIFDLNKLRGFLETNGVDVSSIQTKDDACAILDMVPNLEPSLLFQWSTLCAISAAQSETNDPRSSSAAAKPQQQSTRQEYAGEIGAGAGIASNGNAGNCPNDAFPATAGEVAIVPAAAAAAQTAQQASTVHPEIPDPTKLNPNNNGRPENPTIGNCSSTEVTICWEGGMGCGRPEESATHRVQYQELDARTYQRVMAGGLEKLSWAYGQAFEEIQVEARMGENCRTATVTGLRPSTLYALRVQEVNPSLGNSEFSETVIAETKAAPKKCAVAMRDSFAKEIRKKPHETFPGQIYELTKQLQRKSSSTSVESFDVGNSSSGRGLKPQKVFLLVGETGTGKTTLLDGIANAYYKVQFHDDFRFKLVNEPVQGGGQAVSQTQKITVYTLFPVHGGNKEERSAVEFPLVLIDTPGFGDTRGLQQDKQIVRQISDLLSGSLGVSGLAGVLHGIGFVVRASQNRLTQSQKYVFDQILSLFGKDMEGIIMPLITFGDENEPRVLSALKADKIPGVSQKGRSGICHNNEGDHMLCVVNNGMLYADNRPQGAIDTSNMSAVQEMELGLKLQSTEIQWKRAELAYMRVFEVLEKREMGITLDITKTVLKDRQRLEVAAAGAHRRVQEAQGRLRTILEYVDIIRHLQKSISHASLNMKKTVTDFEIERTEVPDGGYTTMCLDCSRTCHEVCYIPRDEDKKGCAAMDQDGNCTSCEKKCFWSRHVNNSEFIIKAIPVQKEVTVQELFDQYNVDTSEKEAKNKLISKMLKEYEDIRRNMANDISTIHMCLQTLDKLALRQYPLSVTAYVDQLIENEEQRKEPGWEVRVQQYEQARVYAEIISHAREGRDPMADDVQKVLAELDDDDFEELAKNITKAATVGGTRLSPKDLAVQVMKATSSKIGGALMATAKYAASKMINM